MVQAGLAEPLAQGAAQVDRGSKRALAMKALCDLDLSAATKSSPMQNIIFFTSILISNIHSKNLKWWDTTYSK